MALIDFFVKNPAKVTVGVLLMVLFGFVALRQMPMQLTPEVQTPTITIETRWPGASPQEVEQEIIIEQEEQLKGVEGVRKLTSESMDSMGRIILEFNVGTNMDQSIVDVIGQHVQLKRTGSDWRGPCPFHGGANRNFAVIPRKNLYYCFVCHAAGDVFTWHRERFGMDYPTAVREVARRVGIVIPEQVERAGPDPREPHSVRTA